MQETAVPLSRLRVVPRRSVDGAVPIVLSYAAWQARYHADPAIVSGSMTLSGRPAMVIGVMPPGSGGLTKSCRQPDDDIWPLRRPVRRPPRSQ
jgi:hypothetical protein